MWISIHHPSHIWNNHEKHNFYKICGRSKIRTILNALILQFFCYFSILILFSTIQFVNFLLSNCYLWDPDLSIDWATEQYEPFLHHFQQLYEILCCLHNLPFPFCTGKTSENLLQTAQQVCVKQLCLSRV